MFQRNVTSHYVDLKRNFMAAKLVVYFCKKCRKSYQSLLYVNSDITVSSLSSESPID